MSAPRVFSIADIKAAATASLEPRWAEYFNEGAMDLVTVRANEAAWDRYRIMPRILRNVSDLETSTTVFGGPVSFPFAFSPAAIHKLAHPDGEVATSRAAATCGIAMGLSHWANSSLEEVAEAGRQIRPETPYALQTSTANKKEYILELLARAEVAGYKALLLTVDAPVVGRRLNEYRNGVDLPPGLTFPNISYDAKNFKEDAVRVSDTDFDSFMPWISRVTPPSMEIWLKGVYTPEDVLLASQYPRVRGVIVSNHGGRQLDSAPASLESLPDCVAAAKLVNASRPAAADKFVVALDSGVRRGSDIFKALALGASFCLSGRIPIWGLAYDGQAGVEKAIGLLRDEFETCMRLAGCRTLADIGPQCLAVVEGGSPGLIRRLTKL